MKLCDTKCALLLEGIERRPIRRVQSVLRIEFSVDYTNHGLPFHEQDALIIDDSNALGRLVDAEVPGHYCAGTPRRLFSRCARSLKPPHTVLPVSRLLVITNIIPLRLLGLHSSTHINSNLIMVTFQRYLGGDV